MVVTLMNGEKNFKGILLCMQKERVHETKLPSKNQEDQRKTRFKDNCNTCSKKDKDANFWKKTQAKDKRDGRTKAKMKNINIQTIAKSTKRMKRSSKM